MDYLQNETYFYENRQSDVEKLWLVVDTDNEYWTPYGNEEDALKGAELFSTEYPDITIQVGWIWESELDKQYFKTYKAFNPIEWVKQTA